MSTAHPSPWLSSYAPGVPHELDIPDGSLVDIVIGSAKEYPTAVALEFFGGTLRYGELAAKVDRAAEGLRRLGVRTGDPVAIVLPNCIEHVIAFYAVLRLGGIVVEHNPLYTARELRHQFEDHGAKVVIAWTKVVETIQDFPADVAVDSIVSVDVTASMSAKTRFLLRLPIRKARESRAALTTTVRDTVTWKSLVSHAAISATVPAPGADDVALIQYTSGTTGSPKGATLTHRNLIANAAQARSWVPGIERGDGVVYAVLPMFHAYGLTLCLTFAMSMGHRLVLFPRFDPDLVLPVIRKRPPTFFPAVPPIYEKLTAAAEAKGVSLEGIRIAISGAMPLVASVVDPWEQRTGGYLVEGYGLSETSPVLMANPVSDDRKAGTIGLPLPGTEARVVDPENPTAVRETGEPGELVVRGPQVFQGYWKKPEETAAVFADGWFRTGDIVSVDEDGFFTIVDRIKEIVITGGFNVAPSEVEQTLRHAPGVVDAAVIGIPSTQYGEEVVAAVVLEPGAELDAEAIRDYVRRELTPYKVPRTIVQIEELPKSLIGKVLRKKVRDRLLDDGLVTPS